MTATERPATGAPSLERDAIGLPEVLFQSITHMAPAVATALSIGAATTFAGGITPLAVLFAMIAVLFTAVSMAELAKHLPSAGGMYTYVAQRPRLVLRLAGRLGLRPRRAARHAAPARRLRLLRRDLPVVVPGHRLRVRLDRRSPSCAGSWSGS